MNKIDEYIQDTLFKLKNLVSVSKTCKNVCVDEQDYLDMRHYLKGEIGPVAPKEILITSLYGYFNSGAKFWVPNNSLCETPSLRRIFATHPGKVRISNLEVKNFEDIDDWSDEITI